jgi:DNA-binding MarR family transcriptional regulator
MSGDNHPRHDLDEIIHAPVRLSVMAALSAADRVAFGCLRDLVEVSDSLLSKHLATLESAGYVASVKGYEGKRPRTWFALTDDGRAAYQRYRRVLDRLLGGGAGGREHRAGVGTMAGAEESKHGRV